MIIFNCFKSILKKVGNIKIRVKALNEKRRLICSGTEPGFFSGEGAPLWNDKIDDWQNKFRFKKTASKVCNKAVT